MNSLAANHTNGNQKEGEQILSNSRVLQNSWLAYKEHYITCEGRVLGDFNTLDTTSEGQSYAMLRAVWLDDEATFKSVWGWTKANLAREQGGPFAWKWGQRADKSWGVLDVASASDADEDIALALAMAAKKWHKPSFLRAAKKIINSIWETEVVSNGNMSYLTAGDWAPKTNPIRLNPSYFAPYAYRVFAQIDTTHNWLSVIDGSYDVLFQCAKQSRLSLPPDWCNLDLLNNKVTVNPSEKESRYGYDALRIPWRIAADWHWNNEPRSKKFLDTLSFIPDNWKSFRKVILGGSPSGELCGSDEPLSSYGAMLPFLQLKDLALASQVKQEKIMNGYDGGLWTPQDNYYDQNWAWFGLALYWDLLEKPSL